MRSKYEIVADKELRSQGYLVDYKIRPSGFRNPINYSVDYLGNFDLLAYKEGEPLRFISIKGHGGVPGEHRRNIENMKFISGIQKEIWHYIINTNDRRTYRAIKEIIR